ncbi:hypothetical protein AWB83_05999 [Caballeronia ptereochthonis]|uniref:Uncharacterized protein n=1 Tax=Caballeronia ptereochthonis TaxID=1777144 RepID=A0A158DWQ7_9BURK|nr:hypothetical protein AWB83_05999 [Caballeronia ptereochthonis]
MLPHGRVNPAVRQAIRMKKTGDDDAHRTGACALQRGKQEGTVSPLERAGGYVDRNRSAQTAASFSSPVRMRMTRSTSATKILPSPILPVRAAPMIASIT